MPNRNSEEYVPGMVSVIIPCYNQDRFLGETIDSVLAQTYKCLEIIVVDDGSTDHTAEIAKGYGDRVRYFWLDDRGPSAARNRGLQEARGQYILFLDGDDVLFPENLAQQIVGMDTSTSAQLQVSYCDFIHGQAENPRLPASGEKLDWRLDLQQPLLDLARRWETKLSLPTNCFLFDARIFREHGIRFDEGLLPKNYEDFDCWMQVFALPVKLHRVENCLASYRRTPGSATKKYPLERLRGKFLAAIDKHLWLHQHNPELREVLEQKRIEVDARYARKIELSRFSLRRATKSFLRRQGSRLPVSLKSCIKAALRIS